MALHLKRRTFLGLLIGVLPSLYGSAFGQEVARVRRVGVLIGLANDAEMQGRTQAFEQGLKTKGWLIGHNIEILYRFANNDTKRMREIAQEVIALGPDCILAHSTPINADLKKLTSRIPVVFVSVSDPIGSGFVATMARPGGNMTGFTIHQQTITSKHLSILKEFVPRLAEVVALYNPGTAPGGGSFFLTSFVGAASEFDVKAINAQVHTVADIERVFRDAAQRGTSGVVVMPDNFTTFYRTQIISLAAQFGIPTIYPYRYFVDDGGLLSLGVDSSDLFRRASDYVDRILRGAAAADLPVQRPTKVELAINLRTAKALGLEVPRILLAGADVVVE